jgi:hypothetical protein
MYKSVADLAVIRKKQSVSYTMITKIEKGKTFLSLEIHLHLEAERRRTYLPFIQSLSIVRSLSFAEE